MFVMLPKVVDVWRMVTARRSFSGALAIDALDRLKGSLASTDGDVSYALDFGTDDLGVPFLAIKADATLMLTCQRTLDSFALPVHVDSRLGLLRDENEEAALPPGYEPLLVPDGEANLAAVIEDELILAVPLVPVAPNSKMPEQSRDPRQDHDIVEEPRENPFAVLRELKKP